MNEKEMKITFWKKWLIAVRPWALPASVMPVIFGATMAVVIEGVSFRPFHFILSLLAMMILHSGANILSDISDYEKKLDTVPTPVSGAIVRGHMSTRTALKGAVLLFICGIVLGIILALMTNTILLIIGGIGVFVGIIYTRGGILSMKYHALGDFAVFLDFGILGALGAWIVQCESFSWLPVLWAVPLALLVAAILHANNWRDIESDSKGRIKTVASLLEDRMSLGYYGFLIWSPYVIVIGLIGLPRILPELSPVQMPLLFIMVILSVPFSMNLWKKARNRKNPVHPLDFITLDGATARLNLFFGGLATIALILHELIR